jgi:hypothetical protein
MSDLKAKLKPEILAEQPIEKFGGLELVITPKKEFLEWFKNTKGIVGEIEINQKVTDLGFMECPNCKSKMDDYELNNEPDELWHLCSKCNLSFSQRQHRYFTKMIMRLIR